MSEKYAIAPVHKLNIYRYNNLILSDKVRAETDQNKSKVKTMKKIERILSFLRTSKKKDEDLADKFKEQQIQIDHLIRERNAQSSELTKVEAELQKVKQELEALKVAKKEDTKEIDIEDLREKEKSENAAVKNVDAKSAPASADKKIVEAQLKDYSWDQRDKEEATQPLMEVKESEADSPSKEPIVSSKQQRADSKELSDYDSAKEETTQPQPLRKEVKKSEADSPSKEPIMSSKQQTAVQRPESTKEEIIQKPKPGKSTTSTDFHFCNILSILIIVFVCSERAVYGVGWQGGSVPRQFCEEAQSECITSSGQGQFSTSSNRISILIVLIESITREGVKTGLNIFLSVV